MDLLSAERIFGEAARKRLVGCDGEIHDVVESTMDVARRQAVRGAPDGYAVLAERQRAGRGREGAWECPARQGVLASIILRIGLAQDDRMLTSLMGAVGAAEALQGFGVDVRIKWPNDLVVAERCEGLKLRKVGGVLVEQYGEGDAAPSHILGIGINVNQDHRNLPADTPTPATSMKVETGGRALDRNAVCVALLEKLDHWYAKLRLGQPEALLARWRTLSCLLGERVRARVDGRIVEGEVIGLRATGELMLRADSGEEMLLTSDRATLLFRD